MYKSQETTDLKSFKQEYEDLYKRIHSVGINFIEFKRYNKLKEKINERANNSR